MPIKSLQKAATLPELGQLRKGSEKVIKTNPQGKEYSTFGKDLDYFRFTCNDSETVELFNTAFGKEARKIPVYLPFKTTDANFEAWSEAWGAGSLKHRCDGETTVLIQKKGVFSTVPEPCPGGCKQSGRLKVIIPQLGRLAYVTVLTHSKNDIINLTANLAALEMAGGTLQGIPCWLSRVPVMISTPPREAGGERTRVKKYLIQIEAQSEWVMRQIAASAQASIQLLGDGSGQKLLPSYVDEADDDDGDRFPAETSPGDYSDAEAIEAIEATPVVETPQATEVAAPAIDIIEALHRIYIDDAKKTEAEWTAYLNQSISKLKPAEKTKLLNNWQAEILNRKTAK